MTGSTFRFFAMLWQSNLAPSSSAHFDPSQHICRSIISAPTGLLILIRWSKMLQSISSTPVLPISEVIIHPANTVVAYQHLLTSFHASSLNKPLLPQGQIPGHSNNAHADPSLSVMLNALGLDSTMYSHPSLCRGGGTAADRQGLDQVDIKRLGCWPLTVFNNMSLLVASPLLQWQLDL